MSEGTGKRNQRREAIGSNYASQSISSYHLELEALKGSGKTFQEMNDLELSLAVASLKQVIEPYNRAFSWAYEAYEPQLKAFRDATQAFQNSDIMASFRRAASALEAYQPQLDAFRDAVNSFHNSEVASSIRFATQAVDEWMRQFDEAPDHARSKVDQLTADLVELPSLDDDELRNARGNIEASRAIRCEKIQPATAKEIGELLKFYGTKADRNAYAIAIVCLLLGPNIPSCSKLKSAVETKLIRQAPQVELAEPYALPSGLKAAIERVSGTTPGKAQ